MPTRYVSNTVGFLVGVVMVWVVTWILTSLFRGILILTIPIYLAGSCATTLILFYQVEVMIEEKLEQTDLEPRQFADQPDEGGDGGPPTTTD